LARLEKTRDEYLNARSCAHATLVELLESRPKCDFSEEHVAWLRRRKIVMDPLEEQSVTVEKMFFEGFAELVSAKTGRADDFAWKVSRLVGEAGNDFVCRRSRPHHQQSPDLLKAEAALRGALSAVRALPEADCYAIGVALYMSSRYDSKLREYFSEDNCEWVEVLSYFANAAATAVGTGSAAPTDGKLDVNHENWPLLNFTKQLWRLTHEFGGSLNYSRKNGVGFGSLMTALRLLAPLLPKGMLDNPPYAAIEALIREEKSSA
jgi:hypothetical protein